MIIDRPVVIASERVAYAMAKANELETKEPHVPRPADAAKAQEYSAKSDRLRWQDPELSAMYEAEARKLLEPEK